jgi:hypothetical protein
VLLLDPLTAMPQLLFVALLSVTVLLLEESYMKMPSMFEMTLLFAIVLLLDLLTAMP